MGLPKLMYPKFELNVPSTGKTVTVRPFLVKEEKILLLAQQTGETRQIINAIVQVISNCVQDEDFDSSTLTTFDIEYMFVKLRSFSINNLIEITYRDADDNKRYPLEIDLNLVELKIDPSHTNKIKVNEDLTLLLNYPKPNMISEGDNITSEMDVFFVILKNCLNCVYSKDQVFTFSEYPDEEIEEFIQTLDVKTYEQIQKFFQTIPKLHYEAKYKDSEGVEKTAVLNSLNDFFMLG